LDKEDKTIYWAMITDVGRLDGKPFLEIQNFYDIGWCDQGYAYIGSDLFHHIHGLKGVAIKISINN